MASARQLMGCGKSGTKGRTVEESAILTRNDDTERTGYAIRNPKSHAAAERHILRDARLGPAACDDDALRQPKDSALRLGDP